MSDLRIAGIAYAYANHGRWVSDCPRPWCSNAMQIWPGDETFRCEGPDACGWTCPIVWPPDPAAIEVILSARPAAKVRNWIPGETLLMLLDENARHGFLLPEEWTAPSLATGSTTPIMATENEVVVAGGILPAVMDRRRAQELDAELRKQITS